MVRRFVKGTSEMFKLNMHDPALAAFPALDARPRKSHGLVLVEVARHKTGHRDRTGKPVMRIVMTHKPRGKRWSGPGITGSVRRANHLAS